MTIIFIVQDIHENASTSFAMFLLLPGCFTRSVEQKNVFSFSRETSRPKIIQRQLQILQN